MPTTMVYVRQKKIKLIFVWIQFSFHIDFSINIFLHTKIWTKNWIQEKYPLNIYILCHIDERCEYYTRGFGVFVHKMVIRSYNTRYAVLFVILLLYAEVHRFFVYMSIINRRRFCMGNKMAVTKRRREKWFFIGINIFSLQVLMVFR